MFARIALATVALMALGAGAPRLAAQDTTASQVAPDSAGAPVVIGGVELFRLRSRMLEFDAADRADRVEQRLRQASRLGLEPEQFQATAAEEGIRISAGSLTVMTVTPADAAAEGVPLDSLAAIRTAAIRNAVVSLADDLSLKSWLLGTAMALLTLAALALALRLLASAIPRLRSLIDAGRAGRIPALRIQRFEVMPADRVADLLLGFTKVLHIAAIVVLLWIAVPLLLSFFPPTRPFAGLIVVWVRVPLTSALGAIVSYLPKGVSILVIAAVSWFLLRMIKVLFVELGRGTISLSGFHREWAIPTYKIVRFLGIAFTVVLIFPYLPGAESAAFRGVSIFLGVLFSLGSSGAVANVVAGVILTYTRAFEVGDRVKISDTVGDVRQKTLLATKVMTPKSVEITIPNAMVLGSHITNYSSNERGIALHTSVTIGYDVEWRRVHQLLLESVAGIEGILEKPEPFVLQTALGDYAVSYELNAYTDKPRRMPQLYSELHQRIQDNFAGAGVEIMSPAYHALRDGNNTTVPGAGDHSSPGKASVEFRPADGGGDRG